MIHLPFARISEQGKLLLQGGNREPGLAARRILRSFEHRRTMKDEESARLQQETN
jgi:hypothetical protein